MSPISLPKASHVHQCLGGGGHFWEHKTYSCDVPEVKLCPEHEQKAS